ncbi:beta-ketoacyl synthase N-terminal-like domain-containing protein [Actinomadura macra]|uniref:beta-ketoacyl synthase N-terminal-like domain-containing protein n=1 Tax=Actinomadura macra TaxID=46164 RepID=UPI000A056ABA|nr:beta-ketoacyl synthase N-terminal-like domain-containing protein [Actinomadura macra]
MSATRAVISAMSLMSPAGIGVEPFREAVLTGRPSPGGRVEDFRTEPPAGSGRPVRLIDRPSAMALATIGTLLGEDVLAGWPPARRGLVLASGAAGIDQSMTLTRDSLTRPRPDNVNPALVPACVMNYASGQAAIAHDLRGPNATVTAGRAGGLAALRYARLLLARDRADAVVCGAYDDLNERRIAIAEAAGLKATASEGSCVFLVEPAERALSAGRPVRAEILALESGVFAEPRDAAGVLAAAVDRALDAAATAPGDVGLIVPAGTEDTDLPDLAHARVVRTADLIGDVFGAMSAFQIAAAIIGGDLAGDGPALVTSIDPDGHAACCLLRTDPATGSAVQTDEGEPGA